MNMTIVIENPTAETIYEALKQVPPDEVTKLRALLNQTSGETIEDEETAWHQASQTAAHRFFEEEETR